MASRVLILGGGFAGVAAAQALERELVPGEAEVTLVDASGELLFYPLLPEVLLGALAPTRVLVPHERLLPRTDLLVARVEAAVPGEGRVRARLPHGEPVDLAYDHLIVALGSRPDFFGVPGAEAHALTFGSAADALAARVRLREALVNAQWEADPRDRERLLTFAIVGGGFTGIEVAGTLPDVATDAGARVVLLEALPEIARDFPPALRDRARATLVGKHVEIREGEAVASVTPEGLTLSSGESLPAGVVFWTAGIRPAPAVGRLGLPVDRKGRILVDEHLRSVDDLTVWAAGDCAAIPTGENGTYPPTAQHAIREGERAGLNVLRALRGGPPAVFAFEPRGEFATLGRAHAIGTWRGRAFSGRLARAMWRALYLAKIPTPGAKLRVLQDWVADAVTGPETGGASLGGERRAPTPLPPIAAREASSPRERG